MPRLKESFSPDPRVMILRVGLVISFVSYGVGCPALFQAVALWLIYDMYLYLSEHSVCVPLINDLFSSQEQLP